HCRSHALRDETLQLGLDSTVLRSYDVPTRLRSPCSAFHPLFEQICYRCCMCSPDQLLLFFWEITGKGWDTVTFQPNASVCNLDMGENIGRRKLLLQTLCCLIGIRGKRRDVHKRCNSWIGAGRRDDRATIGMTDQDRGVAYTAQGSLHAI